MAHPRDISEIATANPVDRRLIQYHTTFISRRQSKAMLQTLGGERKPGPSQSYGSDKATRRGRLHGPPCAACKSDLINNHIIQLET